MTIKPYDERMDSYYMQGNVQVRPVSFFMLQELYEWRAQASADADKLRRLREGLDKCGWCAEFGELASEVLKEDL